MEQQKQGMKKAAELERRFAKQDGAAPDGAAADGAAASSDSDSDQDDEDKITETEEAGNFAPLMAMPLMCIHHCMRCFFCCLTIHNSRQIHNWHNAIPAQPLSLRRAKHPMSTAVAYKCVAYLVFVS